MSRIATRHAAFRHTIRVAAALAAVTLAVAPVAAQPWGPSRPWSGMGPNMMSQCWLPDGSWNQQACPWHPGGPSFMGPGGWGPGGWGSSSGMMGRWGMGPVDTNGDGVISADEAAAIAEAAFDRMDQDNDDRLTREEVLGARGAVGPMSARMEARFKAMDRNSDGAVDHDEWMAWHQERYRAADINKDGKVSPWEFRAAMRRP